MIQNGSHRYTDLKITFKNPRWRTADAFERPILHYHEISRFFDCQDQAFLNSNFFYSCALCEHVLRQRAKF